MPLRQGGQRAGAEWLAGWTVNRERRISIALFPQIMSRAVPIPIEYFQREDESPDHLFYQQPRMVAHIDPSTIDALSAYYEEAIPANAEMLDLMSSWISHIPPGKNLERLSGVGMNEAELAANQRLDDYVVHDLNADPTLPFSDAMFDVCAIVVSIQYLTRPVEALRDLMRVLRAEGRVHVAMSHRLFPTKAIQAFRQLPPQGRIALVQDYLREAGFDEVGFEDRSPEMGDPLWIVHGRNPPRQT